MLTSFGEQISHWGQADTLETLPNIGLHQLGRIPGQHDPYRMTDLQRSVHRQVKSY